MIRAVEFLQSFKLCCKNYTKRVKRQLKSIAPDVEWYKRFEKIQNTLTFDECTLEEAVTLQELLEVDSGDKLRLSTELRLSDNEHFSDSRAIQDLVMEEFRQLSDNLDILVGNLIYPVVAPQKRKSTVSQDKLEQELNSSFSSSTSQKGAAEDAQEQDLNRSIAKEITRKRRKRSESLEEPKSENHKNEQLSDSHEMTDEQKIQIVKEALRSLNISQFARNRNIKASMIRHWRRDLMHLQEIRQLHGVFTEHIQTSRRRYTDEEMLNIAQESHRTGQRIRVAKKYQLNEKMLKEWESDFLQRGLIKKGNAITTNGVTRRRIEKKQAPQKTESSSISEEDSKPKKRNQKNNADSSADSSDGNSDDSSVSDSDDSSEDEGGAKKGKESSMSEEDEKRVENEEAFSAEQSISEFDAASAQQLQNIQVYFFSLQEEQRFKEYDNFAVIASQNNQMKVFVRRKSAESSDSHRSSDAHLEKFEKQDKQQQQQQQQQSQQSQQQQQQQQSSQLAARAKNVKSNIIQKFEILYTHDFDEAIVNLKQSRGYVIVSTYNKISAYDLLRRQIVRSKEFENVSMLYDFGVYEKQTENLIFVQTKPDEFCGLNLKTLNPARTIKLERELQITCIRAIYDKSLSTERCRLIVAANNQILVYSPQGAYVGNYQLDRGQDRIKIIEKYRDDSFTAVTQNDELIMFTINARRIILVKRRNIEKEVMGVRPINTRHDILLIVAKADGLIIFKGTKLEVLREIEFPHKLALITRNSLTWYVDAKSK